MSEFKPGDVEILDSFIGYLMHFHPDGHPTPGTKITNAEALECLIRARNAAYKKTVCED